MSTSPAQQLLIHQHFGARRFADNWALARVKADLDAQATDPSVPTLAWTLPTLRKAWNQAKAEVAPWWPSCSKEAYASGIADLVAALHHWSTAKRGQHGNRQVGFPRFKARHRDRGRVRFHNGAMRLETDRRHLVLPVIGKVRSKENTRRLERLVAKGRARVLSMTLSEQGGRLFVSVATIVSQAPRRPREPHGRCGIDVGIGTEWAVVAHADDTIERVVHPTPWTATRAQRRRVARRMSRRVVGSRGHRQAKAKLAALDRRAASLRRESLHVLTARLAARYGTMTHHGCGGYRAELALNERRWTCPRCGGVVDRNANAARNLRDWTGPVTNRDVRRGGVAAPVPHVGDHGGQAHATAWACETSEDHRKVAEADDTRTDPPIVGRGTPSRGTSDASHGALTW